MSSGSTKRRSTIALHPGQLARTLQYLRRGDVLLRLGLCVLASFILWLATGAWQPPFAYRTRYTPPRDIVARVEFLIDDLQATRDAEVKAKRDVVCIYSNDPQPLEQLEQVLIDNLILLAGDQPYEKLKETWAEFFPQADQEGAETAMQQEQEFKQFRGALAADENLTSFKDILKLAVFNDLKKNGLLETLEHTQDDGKMDQIAVHPQGSPTAKHAIINSEDVRLSVVLSQMQQRLVDKLQNGPVDPVNSTQVAQRLYTWLQKRLPEKTTLKFEKKETDRARDRAVEAVEPRMKKFAKGDKLVYAEKPNGIVGGEPLDDDAFGKLKDEHRALVSQLTMPQMIVHSLADFGMYVAMYLLCGVYIAFRRPRLLADIRHFSILLFLTVGAVALSWIAAENQWRAELVPMLLFGLTMTVAYRQELALLLMAVASLVLVVSLGQGLSEFVILVVTSSSAILLLGRIRSRTKLVYVGLLIGVVSLATTLGVGTLAGQPLWDTLIFDALRFGLCSLIAALLMTGLLPFIEKLFDVQTDISLLEMGDAAHPLLQELVRRAPGTYNHSINVASIAEAAAEAIGANGLLVRVGAYFHDIGKMLKPGYFIENQGQDASRHDSLVPAMSTLVIIAHVKDGADLARQHHLPQTIIDFIMQHHGTTLVEFFYRQESVRKKEGDPDAEEVDEASFRYPGPKPQTREAGVMMLADAVESASRVLIDPTPSRIENLVHDLTMKRLLDGQFDECELTLKELHTIEESLVKSLTAVYHGRVKYPETQPA